MTFKIPKEEDLDFNDTTIQTKGPGFIISPPILYLSQGTGPKRFDVT